MRASTASGPPRRSMDTGGESATTPATQTDHDILESELACFRAVFCSKTIIPDSEEHPLASSRTVPKAVPRWIRTKPPPRAWRYSVDGQCVHPQAVAAQHW